MTDSRPDLGEPEKPTRKLILDLIEDLVEEFTHYGRKDDEDMPRERFEAAFKAEPELIGACVMRFRVELEARLQTKARYRVWFEDCEFESEEIEAPNAQWAAEWHAGEILSALDESGTFSVQKLPDGPVREFWCNGVIEIHVIPE